MTIAAQPSRATPRDFGSMLRLLRRRARLTQAELGIAVGYSDAQICRLETGRRPPDLTTLVALFFPALQLDPNSSEAIHLLALAAQSQNSSSTTPQTQPPTPPPTTTSTNHSQLPQPATRLIGRHQERAQIAKMLGHPTRLVTLIGPPGVGKTHLALQSAHDHASLFPDGAWFVDLSSVEDPALFAPTILHTLGLNEHPEQDEATVVEHWLKSRQSLLVLDNLEQLRGVAGQIARLLRQAPGLHLLVTSRVALRLAAEQTLSIAPLPIPDLAALPEADGMLAIDSINLLVQRLQAVNPGFELQASNRLALAAICVRVNGLPLALELVASRGQLLTPSELLSEVAHHFLALRRRGIDLPERHRTLSAALSWSYQQLSPDIQHLFDRLSIFVGSWTLEAAITICDLEQRGREFILDGLEILLDHSLIQRHTTGEQSRFSMLTMIHEVAQQHRHERGETEQLHQQHLIYYMQLAEQTERTLQIGANHQANIIALMSAESDNWRAALRWALQQQQYHYGQRLAGAMWRFWYTRGMLREGRRWLEAFLALPADPNLNQERAFMLDGAGILAWRMGEYQQAELWFDQSLQLYRSSTSDSEPIARVLSHRGLVYIDQARYPEALDTYQQALALYQQIEYQVGIASVLHNIGNIHCQRNHYEQAIEVYHQCLKMYHQLGNRSGIALIQLGLGVIARDQGVLDQADQAFQASLLAAQQIGDDWNQATALLNLGDTATDRQDLTAARTYYQQAYQIFEPIGDQQMLSTLQGRQASAEAWLGDRQQAIALFRQSLTLAHAIGFMPGTTDGLEGIAWILTDTHPTISLRLYAVVAQLRQQTGIPSALTDQQRHDHRLSQLKTLLSPAEWQQHWQAGSQLSIHQALSLALTHTTAG